MSKPESCKNCPYYERSGPVWGVGSSSARLAIIGQSPGPEEVKYENTDGSLGAPFVGSSGRVLDRSLSLAGVSRRSEFITNTVKCFVAPGESLDPRAVRACKPLLEKELSLLPQCNTILTLSQPAFNSLTGKELHLVHTRAKPGSKGTRSTTRNPNSWFRGCPLSFDRFSIVGTMHPAYLMRTGFRESPIFDSDVSKAARISRGETLSYTESINPSPSSREVIDYVRKCLDEGKFGLDIETPIKKESEEEELELERSSSGASEIEVVGLSCKAGECVSVSPSQISLLAPLFSPEKETICFAFNGSFDLYHLATHFPIGGNLKLFDPMLALNLLYSECRPKDLAMCASLFTDLPYWKNLMLSDLLRYNAFDTFGVLLAGEEAWRRLKEMGLEDLFWKHEIATLPSLNQMKTIGARCNLRLARSYELHCYQALQGYEKWWRENIPFCDWSSPSQLIEFFARLGLPIQYRTRINPKTKERKQTPSVDDDALELFIQTYGSDAARLIQTMRALRKAGDFCSFYSLDGRAHSSFTLHRQVGGRIQSTKPDLQNLSEELGIAEVYPRKIIIGDEDDHVLINADYEQIELWVYAYLSQDEKLLQTKKEGIYIHGIFYETFFEEPFFQEGMPKKKKNMRPDIPPWKLLKAKTYPLGLIYGRRDLGDKNYIYDNFHRDHPAIGELHKRLEREVYRFGFVRNLFGRIRRIPNFKGMKNEVYNFPGQSITADIIRINALIPLHKTLSDFGARLVLTVYDQVLVTVPERNLIPCIDHIRFTMQAPIEKMNGFSIPVGIKVGRSWGELYSIEDFLSRSRGTASTIQNPS